MQKKINIIVYSILLLLIIGLIILSVYQNKFSKKEYTLKMDALNTRAVINIYDANKKDSKILNQVKELLNKFTDLTNSKKEIGHNLYYIHNNNNKDEYIDIDSDLYDLISYGLSWYDKSDGLIDISSGNIKEAFNNDEYDNISSLKENIEDIVLKDNTIKNNHININLDDIKIGYVVDKISDLLEKNNVEKYYIYIGGVVKVGKRDNKFSIGLEDPSSNNGDIYEVVFGNNISVSTVNYNKDIINLKTYEEVSNVYGLSIVGKNASDTYVISRLAFIYDLSFSEKYINSLDNIEGIWFKFNKEKVESTNFKKYKTSQ